MDLNNFDLKNADAQVLELTNPGTDEVLMQEDGKTPVSITLLGSDSAEFRTATRTFGNKKLQQKKPGKQTIEEMEQVTCRILAQVTIAWSGLEHDGQELVCDTKTAEWLYTEFPWIREQVDGFVNERANFLRSA